jgi:hypothetical protein
LQQRASVSTKILRYTRDHYRSKKSSSRHRNPAPPIDSRRLTLYLLGLELPDFGNGLESGTGGTWNSLTHAPHAAHVLTSSDILWPSIDQIVCGHNRRSHSNQMYALVLAGRRDIPGMHCIFSVCSGEPGHTIGDQDLHRRLVERVGHSDTTPNRRPAARSEL